LRQSFNFFGGEKVWHGNLLTAGRATEECRRSEPMILA
jgi:hypothetical protein